MKSKMIDNAYNLINKELDFYYEGKKYISIFTKKKNVLSKNDYQYIVIFNIKGTEQLHQFRFLQANNLGEISGYLQALANIINFGGELGLEQVEKLMRGSSQYLKGNK
jgi:hypothetical protein